MRKEDIDFRTLPESPGIYMFRGSGNILLYVGRATDLRSRVRSYFSERISTDRGVRIAEMVEKAKRVDHIVADSILDAYILEANYIKKFEPAYNVVDKDNKSFQFVGITDEAFPRVLPVRGRNLEQGIPGITFKYIFGPFPRGSLLKEALRVIRKIFPFRDSCTPYLPNGERQGTGGTKRKIGATAARRGADTAKRPKKCFRAQLGLCPGMCAGLIDEKEYAKRIREIRMFFEGRKKQLIATLEKEMKGFAKKQEFERAEEVRRRLFALTHIQDATMLQRDTTEGGSRQFRIEAYDVAHLGGAQTVGVMTVLIDGEPETAEYRTFTIKAAKGGDDIGALKEILERRLRHPEWRFPHLIVIDGGRGQINAAEMILRDNEMRIPIVSVVKTEKHTPREILGDRENAKKYEKDIIRANAEAHRFAVARHRHRRKKELFS